MLDSIAGSDAKGAVRDALATPARLDLDTIGDRAVAAGVGGKIAASPGTTTRNTATVLADLHEVEGRQFDQLIGDARASNSSAQRSAKLFLIAGLVVVLGAAGAAIFLGRRITGPLARLTDAANHLSTEQMPRLIETLKNPGADADVGFQIDALRPIEVRSGDEIGQLSTAFNEVQRVAGEVAAEQASLLKKGIGDMFVNLARRNQALLDRQIEFIDELERGEEDPDQLDNLYKLDHLATRMRRNAESLLVLAGAEPPRRRGRPAPLANVVRAALAEVEDFGRIELLSFDEVLVASNAAADLAHLLSELMENATNFSPPETRVEVVGHRTNADGYVISVTDHGIGMSGRADRVGQRVSGQAAARGVGPEPVVGLHRGRAPLGSPRHRRTHDALGLWGHHGRGVVVAIAGGRQPRRCRRTRSRRRHRRPRPSRPGSSSRPGADPGAARRAAGGASAVNLADGGSGLRVRPYAMTGGRTRSATEVAIEAIVYRTPRGDAVAGSLSFERGQILALVTAPQSAAAISAHLHLPLGVARVLVGDLVDEGFLALNTRSATGRPDLRLLERVLDGLRAL